MPNTNHRCRGLASRRAAEVLSGKWDRKLTETLTLVFLPVILRITTIQAPFQSLLRFIRSPVILYVLALFAVPSTSPPRLRPYLVTSLRCLAITEETLVLKLGT